MSPGSSTESYPAFARIGLRENPGKTSTRVMQQSRDHTCNRNETKLIPFKVQLNKGITNSTQTTCANYEIFIELCGLLLVKKALLIQFHFHFQKYPKIVERRFRQQWPEKQPPDRHTITTWDRKLLETGSLVEKTPRGKKVTEEQGDRIQQAFQRSPCKFVRRASRELAIPKSTIHDVLHKTLRLHAYKIQLVQKLKPNDLPARYDFASDMLLKIDIENGYLKKVVFSDESTFHVCGFVNRHNCRIWGSENPHVARELERDSPKINVWCGLTNETVIGPFFFCGKHYKWKCIS
ncbi:hypothetical protein ANN_13567 [Periplaneta americana]|uniref:DUF4817 domain-containing protein n=1 Tax=Periplaneta americana TaxID=6978 RepID=A0ABQ8TMC4_PERAM|nr:hypothetical protein ANN_13567 [Periplaneta americana]